jgi:hypothetical protein
MASEFNFSDTTPTAPTGAVNAKWQSDASTTPNVSAYIPAATSTSCGVVKPDGSTITIATDGTISAVASSSSNALPTTGGVLTGSLTAPELDATTINGTTVNATNINSSGNAALANVSASAISSGSVIVTGLASAGYVTNTSNGTLQSVAQIPASGIADALASPTAIGSTSANTGTFSTLAANKNIWSPEGDFTNINATTTNSANINSSGTAALTTLTAASASISGAATVSSVTASGEVEGAYIKSTGSIDCVNLNASSALNGASLSVTGSVTGSGFSAGSLTVSGMSTLGNFILTGGGTATSADAGSASALPAKPLGYWVFELNGTWVKVPYYAG